MKDTSGSFCHYNSYSKFTQPHKKERLFDNTFYDIIESVEKVNY